VCGGNILDDDHLHAFKSALLLSNNARERDRLNGQKIAATFFFHEHVVALHVVRDDDDNTWIELIDSLPDPKTWNDNDNDLPQNAVRVRCTDDEIAFDTLIRHYACSKFSKEEKQFIDGTVWEDNNGESDPRVFQAFIWASDNADADAAIEFSEGFDSLSDTDDEANIVSSMSSCSSGEKSGNIGAISFNSPLGNLTNNICPMLAVATTTMDELSGPSSFVDMLTRELHQNDEIRALKFFLKHRNDQLKEIQADNDDNIDRLKKEIKFLKEKLRPAGLIHPYRTGNHPDEMINNEAVTMKKSVLDGSKVTSKQFDRHVDSYVKDVIKNRDRCHQSYKQLISRIREKYSWTDDDSVRGFAFAIICCAARAFVPQPKRKVEAEKEGKIISRSDVSTIYSFLSLTTTTNLSGLNKAVVEEMKHNLHASKYYSHDPFSAEIFCKLSDIASRGDNLIAS